MFSHALCSRTRLNSRSLQAQDAKAAAKRKAEEERISKLSAADQKKVRFPVQHVVGRF